MLREGAALLDRLGEIEAAGELHRRLFTQLLRQFPAAAAELLPVVARFALARNRLPLLEELARAGADVSPVPAFELHRAQALLVMARPAEAAAALETLLERGVPDGLPSREARFLVWQAHLAAGNPERAAELVAEGPGDPPTLHGRAGSPRRDFRVFALWLHPDQERNSPLLAYSPADPPAPLPLPDSGRASPHPTSLTAAAVKAAMEQILARIPDCWPALVELARARAAAGDLAGCGRALQAAAAAKPAWWLPHWLLAGLYRFQENGDAAALALAEARYRSRLVPDPARAGADQVTPTPSPADQRYARAIDLLEAGKFDAALKAFGELGQPPHQAAARRGIGAVSLAQGRLPEAAAVWASSGLRAPLPIPEALAADGRWPDVGPVKVAGRGLNLGDYPRAYVAIAAARRFAAAPIPFPGSERLIEALLRLAVRCDPDSTPVTLALADFLRAPARFVPGAALPRPAQLRDARALLEALLARNPKNARALAALGRDEEAARADSDYLPARRRLADRYLAARDPRAVAELEAVVGLSPQDAGARERLVLAHHRHGFRRLALEAAQRMVAAGRRSRHRTMEWRGRLLSGILYQHAGLPEIALAEYGELIGHPEAAGGPSGATPRFLAALAHLEAGRLEAAAPLLGWPGFAQRQRRMADLFRAWLAHRRGDVERRSLHLAAARPAAGEHYSLGEEVQLFSLDRSLSAILAGAPDCFAARYLLAARGVKNSAYRGRTGGEAVRLAQAELRKLAAEFPDWSAPLLALAPLGGTLSPEQARAARQRQRREVASLEAMAERERPVPPRLPLAPAWSADTGTPAGLLAEGSLLLTWGPTWLRRHSPLNGAPLADRELPRTPVVPVLAGGRLIVHHGQVAAAYDPRTLRRLWVQPLPALVPVRAVGDERIVVFLLASGHLVGLDAASGDRVWTTSEGAPGSALLARNGNQVVAGAVTSAARGGRLQAFGLADGRRLWQADLAAVPEGAGAQWVVRQLVAGPGRMVVLASPPVAGRRAVFLAAAFDTAGKRLWAARLLPGRRQAKAFALDGGRQLLVVGDYSATGLVLETASGKEKPPLQLDRQFSRHAVIGASGPWLFARSPSGQLSALEASTARVLWQSSPGVSVQEAAVVGSRIVVLASGGRLLGYAAAP